MMVDSMTWDMYVLTFTSRHRLAPRRRRRARGGVRAQHAVAPCAREATAATVAEPVLHVPFTPDGHVVRLRERGALDSCGSLKGYQISKLAPNLSFFNAIVFQFQ